MMVFLALNVMCLYSFDCVKTVSICTFVGQIEVKDA